MPQHGAEKELVDHMVIYGYIWSIIWLYMVLYGDICLYMVIYGSIWLYMFIYIYIYKYGFCIWLYNGER